MPTAIKSIKQFFNLLSKSKAREFIKVASGTDVHLIDPGAILTLSATSTAHELFIYVRGFHTPLRIYGEKDTLKFLKDYTTYLAQFEDV